MKYERFEWSSPYIRCGQRFGLEIFGEADIFCFDAEAIAKYAIERIRKTHPSLALELEAKVFIERVARKD
ncbi:hypothetical protein ACFQUU_16425 [Herbaspirillum sp. GCM10030257]|uniref:hypothetical protein n=1 Tax=Herbaspirillum sp. GCM10030257 TaxID=3273393 RepID=UPI00361D55C0